jgi:hypothetical protein
MRVDKGLLYTESAGLKGVFSATDVTDGRRTEPPPWQEWGYHRLVHSEGDAMQPDTFVLGWGSLALINAALANIDRRGPLKYLLGSLIFGPLVTVILAATREDASGGLRQVDLWNGRGAATRGD